MNNSIGDKQGNGVKCTRHPVSQTETTWVLETQAAGWTQDTRIGIQLLGIAAEI